MPLPLIAKADFPAFLAMGMHRFPATYEAWITEHEIEKRKNPADNREIPVSPQGFRNWLCEGGQSASVENLRRYAVQVAHEFDTPRFAAGYKPPDDT